MKVITLASFKGGSGKSTAAVAILSALIDRKAGSVFLLDIDPQASSFGWLADTRDLYADAVPPTAILDGKTIDASLGDEEAFEQMFAILESASNGNGFDYCVIDTQGAQTPLTIGAMNVSDLVLIPMQATGFEIEPFARTVEIALKSMDVPGARVAGLFTRMPNIASTSMLTARKILAKNGIDVIDGTEQRTGYELIAIEGGTFAMLEARKREESTTQKGAEKRRLERIADQARAAGQNASDMIDRIGIIDKPRASKSSRKGAA